MKQEYKTPDMEIIFTGECMVITESFGSDGDDDYGYWPNSVNNAI